MKKYYIVFDLSAIFTKVLWSKVFYGDNEGINEDISAILVLNFVEIPMQQGILVTIYLHRSNNSQK